jgi:hypothetical protein
VAAAANAAKRKKRRRESARCVPPKKRRRSRAKRSSELQPAAIAKRRKRRKTSSVVCNPKRGKARARTTKRWIARQPVPSAPRPPAGFRISSPIAVYSGQFGVREAERLLWRAGFGPSPGHAALLAGMGLHRAVAALTRPADAPRLTGAEPTVDGEPIHPEDAWGHDHLWFLDRMVRTNQPLVERMTLIWHDWFATSASEVEERHMLAQNQLFRRHALGSFLELVAGVTADPAMILWLNQDQNRRGSPNENYVRELMELFTLGADRGAYSEDDVRELARALTGWDSDWSSELGHYNFRFVPSRHDTGNKTVFGKTGAFNWLDACRLCVTHPKHASFFVEKLWSYFIPVPPPAADRAALERAYVSSGYAIRPLVEAILLHPLLIKGPRMVKPPVVYLAGMLRQQRRAIDTDSWAWLSDGMGQRLFRPPNVAGWDDSKWLDTSTLRGRWRTVTEVLNGRHIQGTAMDTYDAAESADAAVRKARDFWGDPAITPEGNLALNRFSATCLPAVMANWQQHTYRAIRQNALRQLLAVSPDMQTS